MLHKCEPLILGIYADIHTHKIYPLDFLAAKKVEKCYLLKIHLLFQWSAGHTLIYMVNSPQ